MQHIETTSKLARLLNKVTLCLDELVSAEHTPQEQRLSQSPAKTGVEEIPVIGLSASGSDQYSVAQIAELSKEWT